MSMSSTSSKVRQPSSCKEESNGGEVRRRISSSAAGKSVLDFFPGESFREGQKEALEQIECAFNEGKKYVIAELPTGTGKSLIAVAFAGLYRTAHIITAQKILQSQYEHTEAFKNKLFVMKGRSAYGCRILVEELMRDISNEVFERELDGLTESELERLKTIFLERTKEGNLPIYCDKGPCRKNKKIKCDNCDYQTNLNIAVESAVVVHNFDSFFYQTTISHAFVPSTLLVIDEAHQIEAKYLNFMEFTLSNKKYPMYKFSNATTVKDATKFIDVVYNDYLEQIKDLNGKQKDYDLTEQEVRDLDEAKEAVRRIWLCKSKLNSGAEYVVDFKDRKEYQTLTFRPIDVGSYAKEHLFSYGSKVLMLSATIIDKNYFCRNVGLNPNEVTFVQIGSFFPAKNRPIFKRYAGPMTFDHIAVTLPLMLKQIKIILEKMGSRKGIIQTHTERIATYIQENIKNNRLTFRRDYRTVDEMLSVHEKKETSVIVASGLREGLDLREDLSRFQIICKVPFLDLSDKRVKRKKELDPTWYSISAVLAFVQMIGRSIRSRDDRAITYLLDSSFDSFFKWNKRYIPGYIWQSIHKDPIK